MPVTSGATLWFSMAFQFKRFASSAIEKGEMLIASTSFCLELDLQNRKKHTDCWT